MKVRKGLTTKGSLTLECSLILPIFIFAIMAFLYLFQIFILHDMLQQAITKEGLELSKYGYAYQYISDYEETDEDIENESRGSEESTAEESTLDEGATEGKLIEDKSELSTEISTEVIGVADKEAKDKVAIADENSEKAGKKTSDNLLKELLITKNINNAFFHYKLGDYLDKDYINRSVIKGGMEGLSFYLSSFMEEKDQVDIVLTYYIRPPILLLPIDDFYMMQRVTLRGWNGYRPDKANAGNEEEEPDYVYITETGSVYHVSESCSHLTRSIRQIPFSAAKGESNIYGGKYYACELCGDKVNTQGKVYITDTGDRYHSSISCSGLKRTILKIPLSEVGGRSLCTRCGGKK